MFEPFSRSYMVGRLYVTPYDGSSPAMNRGQHESVNEALHADDPLVRIDAPLVMKVDEQHLLVEGDGDIPGHTLAVPGELIDDLRVRNPPERKEVLLAKPDSGLEFMV